MQQNRYILQHQDCTFGEAGKRVFWHLESVDNQHIYIYKNHSNFTGKEKDSESGYYYFGARYLDQDMTTLFLSVDPMADKYPSLSPYAYCMWNPIKLVDPDGRDYGDYYDRSGKYLGWDGKNNNCVYIVGNYSDIIKIKENDKKGKTTSLNDLVSEPLLITTYGVLRESCNVLNRAEKNSKQTKEEGSIVDYYSGVGLRGKTGTALHVDLPKTPDWISTPVSIHSHNKYNDATNMSNHNQNIGDADLFGNFFQNVIVGPLGVGGEPGLCFYRRTFQKEDPIYTMNRAVAEKIISQQFLRMRREIKKKNT